MKLIGPRNPWIQLQPQKSEMSENRNAFFLQGSSYDMSHIISYLGMISTSK